MTVMRICTAAVLCLACLAASGRGGFAATLGEKATAQDAPPLLIENRTGIFTLLGISFAGEGKTVEDQTLNIESMGEGAIRNPGLEKADIDVYLGMNDVHFLFVDVPVRHADRLIVGFTRDSTPTLEAYAKETAIHVGTGRLTLENMAAPE